MTLGHYALLHNDIIQLRWAKARVAASGRASLPGSVLIRSDSPPFGLKCEKFDNNEEFITVYRGDRPGTKVIKSLAAKKGGYNYSKGIIEKSNLDDLLKAHADDSSFPPSPFISVTTDRRVAEFFAGPDGIVNEFKISTKRIIKNIHNDFYVPAGKDGGYISESEWLVPNYIKPSEFVR